MELAEELGDGWGRTVGPEESLNSAVQGPKLAMGLSTPAGLLSCSAESATRHSHTRGWGPAVWLLPQGIQVPLSPRVLPNQGVQLSRGVLATSSP